MFEPKFKYTNNIVRLLTKISGAREVILNSPVYYYKTNDNGEITDISAPHITLHVFKKHTYTETDSSSDDPTTDISNPLMFFTSKMGSYPTTIMENLSLSGLSIQVGGTYKDKDGNWIRIPTWSDYAYAQDYANWQLSKRCDKQIIGNIQVTLDCACFNGIDLSKRINIDGITESAMNINSITYNLSTFTVNIELQNHRYYKRSSNIGFRG